MYSFSTALNNKLVRNSCYLIISILPILSSASETTQEFNLTEISDNNFVHIGKHVSIEDDQHDDIANIGFIIGQNCVAVIDTGGSVTIGQKLLEKIRSVTDKPICYVINTHIHFDHILGNKVFVSDETKFVGHHKLAEAVEHNRDFFLQQFKSDLGKNPDPSSVIGPGILVTKTTKLDLGDHKLTLIPFATSHSHNDLIVIDEKTKTLWSGDLIFRQRIPSLTGSLKGWIKTMDALLQLDAKVIVPGHGSIATSIKQAIDQQQNYLLRLLQDTRAAIEKGHFINDAMETIDKENQSNWLLHDYQHASNVSKAFTELEWE